MQSRKFRIVYDLRDYIFKLFEGTTLYYYIFITFYFSIKNINFISYFQILEFIYVSYAKRASTRIEVPKQYKWFQNINFYKQIPTSYFCEDLYFFETYNIEFTSLRSHTVHDVGILKVFLCLCQLLIGTFTVKTF